MKKLLSLALSLALLLVGCESEKEQKEQPQPKKEASIINYDKEYRAVWLAYPELNFSDKSEEEFKEIITERFDNIKKSGFKTVIVHARANGDACYPSKFFPFSSAYSGKQGESPSYDPLGFMVECAKQKDLRIEAWINPYRISASSSDVSLLAETNIARIWLEDEKKENDENVLIYENGIYLNPASEEVRQLITDGINEILENYDVDGIHFDDYFYPTSDPLFDKTSYDKYKNEGGNLALDEWRRTNVSLLISECYKAVHKFRKKTFGISPAAAISDDKTDKNYCEYFADVYSWMSTEGFIDYIAPQLYFGYDYGEDAFKFDNLLKTWSRQKRNEKVKLYIGLAAYKIGTEDSGSQEWIESEGILARQLQDSRLSGSDGFLIYSYSGLFSEDAKNKSELNAIKELIK